LPPARRTVDRDRALAERRRSFPATYAPFTIDEYRAMPLDYSFIDQCLDWPVAPPSHPAAQLAPAGAAYPDIPALVVSGELDNITTVADGAAVARAFKQGRQVIIANSFHVNALPRARSSCGADLVRRFVATMDIGDAACASRVPPVRLVPRFVRRAQELEPARALSGNVASAVELKFAAAAVLTAGDVVTRMQSNSTGHGVGLRGGRFDRIDRGGSWIATLDAVRWTDDVTVSGSVARLRGRSGRVRARLLLIGTDHVLGRLAVHWNDDAAEAMAEIRGSIGVATVVARMPAP